MLFFNYGVYKMQNISRSTNIITTFDLRFDNFGGYNGEVGPPSITYTTDVTWKFKLWKQADNLILSIFYDGDYETRASANIGTGSLKCTMGSTVFNNCEHKHIPLYQKNGWFRQNGGLLNVELIVEKKEEIAIENMETVCLDHVVHSSLAPFLFDETTTDVSLRVGNETIPVHKLVLMIKSPVFKAMFQTKMVEAISNEIQMSVYQKVVVETCVKYFYTDEIDPHILKEHVYAIVELGHQYEISDLLLKCEQHLLQREIEDFIFMLNFAATFQLEKLKEAVFKHIGRQPDIVKNKLESFKALNPDLLMELLLYLIRGEYA